MMTIQHVTNQGRLTRLVTFYLCKLILTGLVAILWTGCSTLPQLQKSQGTIYFGDAVGIWKMTPSGENTTLLAAGPYPDILLLSLSPNEEWLAYSVARFGSGTEVDSLWVVSTKGGIPIQATPAVVGLLNISWLNDQLLYFDGQNAFLFDPKLNTRRIAQSVVFHGCFNFVNPAGTGKMLESCRPTETSRGYLRMVNLDGTNPVTITEPYQTSYQIQWSTNGEQVLFADGDLGYQKLFVWNSATKEMHQITGEVSQQERLFGDLSWSPDGQWIASVDREDLCVINVATGKVKCFERIVSAHGTRVAWSPNSDAILISSNMIGKLKLGDADLQWDLFVIGIPGGSVSRVTNNSQLERRFAWGR